MILLKILHIGKYHPPFHGGIENFMSDLMNEQVNKGHQVQAAVHHHELRKRFHSEKSDNIVLHRIPTHGSLVFVPIAPSFGKHLNHIVEAFLPDVIHMHMPNVSCFWPLFSSELKRIPWVIHWHSDVIGAAPDWRIKLLYPFYRLFEKALLKRSKRVIATSVPYLDSSWPLKAFRDKCEVVQLGIKELPLNSMNMVAKKGLRLLCIGRLTYYKGHEVLLRALAQLKNKDISITVVGKGDLEPELKSLSKGLGLNEIANFVGSLSNEQLEHELKSCDLLCLPSIERTEAFGVVLLEAMRASKPCLVTDVEGSGMSWVVEDEYTGFIVPVGDVNTLANKLSDIHNDKSNLKKLGENGYRRFESEFTIERVAAKIDDVYAGISNNVN